jgi:hypothetical protein
MASRPLRPVERQFKVLVHEREARVKEQNRERNRCYTDQVQAAALPPIVLVQRRKRLAQLKAQIAQLDAAIEALLSSNAQLSQLAAPLQANPASPGFSAESDVCIDATPLASPSM